MGVFEEIVGEKVTKVWRIEDLVVRYSLRDTSSLKELLKAGLPCQTDGSTYCFVPEKVTMWEIETEGFKRGAGDYFYFPAFKYAKKKRSEWAKAVKTQNNELKKQIVVGLGDHDINPKWCVELWRAMALEEQRLREEKQAEKRTRKIVWSILCWLVYGACLGAVLYWIYGMIQADAGGFSLFIANLFGGG